MLSLTLADQASRGEFPEMAAGYLRVQGFFATLGRAAGLIAPFKTSTRPFRSSRWALRELQTKPQPHERVYEGVEYIPQKKAKNPMKPVAIAWAIGFPSGIILFLLTKRQVDKNRLKKLKIRQKMAAYNEGEHDRKRYRTASLGTEGLVETKT